MFLNTANIVQKMFVRWFSLTKLVIFLIENKEKYCFLCEI